MTPSPATPTAILLPTATRRARLSAALNVKIAVGGSLILLIVLATVLAPVLTPWDPMGQDLASRLRPPTFDFGAGAHPLGTDTYGRDVFSQLLYGARYSLTISAIATVLSGVIGVGLAVLAGWGNHWAETVVMRLVDAMQSLPAILVALMAVALHGTSLVLLTAVLALTGWPTYTRILFGVVTRVRQQEYIAAAVCTGVPVLRIIRRHALPNILSPIVVITTLELGRMLLLEAGLSFLGLGVPVSLPAWGTMLGAGQRAIFNAPYLSIIPGVAIALAVFSINLLGDGLRQSLDPRG